MSVAGCLQELISPLNSTKHFKKNKFQAVLHSIFKKFMKPCKLYKLHIISQHKVKISSTSIYSSHKNRNPEDILLLNTT